MVPASQPLLHSQMRTGGQRLKRSEVRVHGKQKSTGYGRTCHGMLFAMMLERMQAALPSTRTLNVGVCKQFESRYIRAKWFTRHTTTAVGSIVCLLVLYPLLFATLATPTPAPPARARAPPAPALAPLAPLSFHLCTGLPAASCTGLRQTK